MKQVIVVAGVTASGKSKLGVALAHAFDGEIVNADSVSVYRELNIGSAKPTLEEMQNIPHHLLDVCSITESYNVARFQKEARAVIAEIHDRNKMPIIVGGTGLYINALIKKYHFAKETEAVAEDKRSNETLHAILEDMDANQAAKIHVNNRQRLLRAVHMHTIHQQERETIHHNERHLDYYDAKVFFLNGDRDRLYQRIHDRVERMFALGLLEEVTDLKAQYDDFFDLPSTQAIGYKEFAAYFENENDLDQVKETIKKNTRRFAKRQITWFRHQLEADWIDIFEENHTETLMNRIAMWKKLD